jgi:hypothetical protein
MKTGKFEEDLPPMQEHETYIFYADGKHNHGVSKDCRRYPSLIFSILRHTIMPKVGNSDAVRIPYYEAIRAIMSEDKLNIVEWMATRMVECKLDRSGALVFQPYIMALIRHKTGFLGIDGVVHRHFRPFKNKKEALE